MNSTTVLTAFRDHLLANNLIRKASIAGAESATGAAPPCHIEPLGMPAPGEREAPENDSSLVVTIRLSSTLGERTFDSYRRRYVFDVIYRSQGTGALKRGRVLDGAITALLTERADYGLGWTMGSSPPVVVLSSTLYTGLGPVSRSEGEGATELAKYAFEVLAA